MKKIYIFGCSGFSREVADICLDIGYTDIIFVDNHPINDNYFGFPVICEGELKNINIKDSNFAIGIGEPDIREKIHGKFPNLNYPNLVHPSVTFGRKQKESLNKVEGNILCAGSRFTNNIQFGNFGVYNLNVTVGHDCVVHNFITVSPGVNVSGNVEIENNVYLGTGSTILQGTSIESKLIIGEYSTVGAGAVVVKNVPTNVVVKGIPAK